MLLPWQFLWILWWAWVDWPYWFLQWVPRPRCVPRSRRRQFLCVKLLFILLLVGVRYFRVPSADDSNNQTIINLFIWGCDHFFPVCGPWSSFSSSSFKIWLVLFCCSTLFLWALRSASCCSLSRSYMSSIFYSSLFTYYSNYFVCPFRLLILFSISFFFC